MIETHDPMKTSFFFWSNDIFVSRREIFLLAATQIRRIRNLSEKKVVQPSCPSYPYGVQSPPSLLLIRKTRHVIDAVVCARPACESDCLLLLTTVSVGFPRVVFRDSHKIWERACVDACPRCAIRYIATDVSRACSV